MAGPDPPSRGMTPYDLVITPDAEQQFGAVREALAASGTDPLDRDAFLMIRPVVELIHALRPDEGLGHGMDQYVVLFHLAYLYWAGGRRVARVGDADLARLGQAPVAETGPEPGGFWLEFPALRIWGAPIPDAPPEPLHGSFVAGRGDRLTGAAIFGFHPQRGSLSVVAVEGGYPGLRRREDGSPLFAPTLPGAERAGHLWVADMGELLELLWRAVGGRGVAT
jgi:hypothetical protein